MREPVPLKDKWKWSTTPELIGIISGIPLTWTASIDRILLPLTGTVNIDRHLLEILLLGKYILWKYD